MNRGLWPRKSVTHKNCLPASSYPTAWLSAPRASLTLGQVSVVCTMEGTGQVKRRTFFCFVQWWFYPLGTEYIISLSFYFVTHSRKGMCNQTGNMLELLLIQYSFQQTDSSGSEAFCVLRETSAGLAVEWGVCVWGCRTARPHSVFWSLGVGGASALTQPGTGGERQGFSSRSWDVLLYYAVACGQLLTEVLWRQEAHEAEGILGPSLSYQFAVWNWHSSVLLAYC